MDARLIRTKSLLDNNVEDNAKNIVEGTRKGRLPCLKTPDHRAGSSSALLMSCHVLLLQMAPSSSWLKRIPFSNFKVILERGAPEGG